MNLVEAQRIAREVLGNLYEVSIKDCLLEKVLGISREKLLVQNNICLSLDQGRLFLNYLNDVAKGRPLAYILGFKEFYGIDFFVDGRVLVPRPESEFIVEEVVKFFESRGKGRVVDVGTGSGNILMSILVKLERFVGIGIDVSELALEVANINRERLGLVNRCELRVGNLLDGVSGDFEVIVANLPYIGRKRFNFVGKNVVDFEPEVALFGGDDGLDLYRQMFNQILEMRIGFELLIGEFGFGQRDLVEGILVEKFGKLGCEILIIPDYAGIDRVFVVKMEVK